MSGTFQRVRVSSQVLGHNCFLELLCGIQPKDGDVSFFKATFAPSPARRKTDVLADPLEWTQEMTHKDSLCFSSDVYSLLAPWAVICLGLSFQGPFIFIISLFLSGSLVPSLSVRAPCRIATRTEQTRISPLQTCLKTWAFQHPFR